MFNGGFGGLGQGERVTGKMDINSELWLPLAQTIVYILVIVPSTVFAIFLDVFVLQPEGLNIALYIIILFAAFLVFAGGRFTVWAPVMGEREITLPSTRTRTSVIVLTLATAAALFVWWWYGYAWLCDLWYGFWPIVKVLWWEICLPCVHTPLWLALIILASSFGVFRAVGLLGFRLRYEIVDPMWPPTIQQRSPMTGPYGPDWQPIYEEPDKQAPTVAQTRNGKTAKSWAFYTPPTGVTQKQVYLMCVAIEQTLDADGRYTWPGEGNVSGVGQKPHRKIQDDWEVKGYCKKQKDNTYILTDQGAVVMKKVVAEGI